jgi:hypothetical protein
LINISIALSFKTKFRLTELKLRLTDSAIVNLDGFKTKFRLTELKRRIKEVDGNRFTICFKTKFRLTELKPGHGW